eukprot:TRINITY_DN10583_c0_g1_i1.p1 TRINITY_DN10583_c0_g1~~TRINITY_DN10583_c0_g1_i1.p1  ORF type:complete len:208 (-),score=13.48 TRINITY_DN10583_c0_g1_i1:33-623(-)
MPQNEITLQMIAVVLTNLSFLPVAVLSWKRRNYVLFVIFVMTFITSLMYHFAETLDRRAKFFGMTPGNWHRIDNICAILTFQVLAVDYARIKYSNVREGVRWALLMICLWCQEKGPWDVVYTIIPIVFSFIVMLFNWFFVLKTIPPVGPRFWMGTSFGLVALFFFYQGLDDDNDWIRLNHGLWHFFAGCSIFSLLL